MDLVDLVQKFGFPTVMVMGLGYFVFFVWQTITKTIDPSVNEMKKTIKTSRSSVKENAPKIIKLKIKQDKIREVIGSGGKIIKNICSQINLNIYTFQ